MFESFFPYSADDAIVILKSDHKKIKDLFDKFEKAENLRQKKKIVAYVITELKIHTALEEEIFYPTVRKPVGKEIMNEADEEHHVAKVLIAELEEMDGTEEHYDAKFKVLSENVRHHIREEENEMMPKARALEIDFELLGQKMLARKQQLLKTGVATSSEEKMVAKSKGKGDSPAQAAKKNKALKLVKASKTKHVAKVLKLSTPAKATAKKPRSAATTKNNIVKKSRSQK